MNDCLTGLGTALFRAELAMEYSQVVVQFTFRIVPSVALTTGDRGHLLFSLFDIRKKRRGPAGWGWSPNLFTRYMLERLFG
jgi:hypothetical protein